MKYPRLNYIEFTLQTLYVMGLLKSAIYTYYAWIITQMAWTTTGPWGSYTNTIIGAYEIKDQHLGIYLDEYVDACI